LSHPNIAGIYDLAESESIQCLVLEFVEGETLAARLNRGRIPFNEALTIGRQIAEALETAHEHGIVHRDLKPANVMIATDGTVKVLDFGIAELLASDGSASFRDAQTRDGASIVGTPSYMSPEQARGNPADKRTDIWAFGCVLYEVLSGTRAFAEGPITDTLAAVVDGEPDWSLLPARTPTRIENLLRRCLHKDPRWRLRDIGDARIELADDRSEARGSAAADTRFRPWLVGVSSIIVLALTGALLALWSLRRVPALPEMRVEITTPPSADPVSLAISPDGRTLAFVATHEGRSRLWLRPLGSTSPRSLEGTDGASCPFWSPDGAAIGFFADGKLKRIDVDTGSVRTLTSALSCGGTWNGDGTILYAAPLVGPISRIHATSTAVTAAARVDVTRTHGTSHRFPQFLPDGRHFLYYAAGSPDRRGVYIDDLDGSHSKRVLDADTAAVYVTSGHLLFVRQGTLFAQKFDPKELVLSGNPFPVEQHVAFDPTRYVAAVSASSADVFVYRSGSATGKRQFVWVDRSGKEIEKVGDPDPANPLDPELSPDEHRVALYRVVNGRPDIWLLEPGGARNRFTSEEITAATAGRPIWSPDGTQIVFASLKKKVTDLFRRPVAGGNIELLLETDQPKAATDWSTDGRFLLYRTFDPKTGWDIWALPMDSRGRPGARFTVLQTNFDETNGQLSPDAKWVAYQSNETGRFEVYLQPFPGPGSKSPVSRSGGAQVRWRRDGKELFYVGLDARLMAVPIRLASKGPQIEIGTPVALFTTHIGGAVQGADRQQYMVSSDGQRFLMNAIVEEPTAPIIMVLNWMADHR
jgi:Tol biopolymer transport system component